MILVKEKIRSEQNICMLIGIYFLVLIAIEFFCGASNNMLKTKIIKKWKIQRI